MPTYGARIESEPLVAPIVPVLTSVAATGPILADRPGRIIDDSAVNFARPRSIDMAYQPEFVTMTQRLRELIIANRPNKDAA